MKSRYKKNKKMIKKEIKEVRRPKRIKILIILGTILLLLFTWGKFVEPNLLTINDYKIVNENIPDSFKGIRIVQFSDLHYGMTKEKRLEKIVNNINSLKPDIVVFTGDLIEEGYEATDNDLKILIKNLKNINAKLGKYAIYGNHDISNENYDNIMYDSKITILKNNYDTVYNEKNEAILIYGLDDTLEGEPKISNTKSKDINSINYKIVLVHEPDYINEFIYDYDASLVLAGHSHGAQINIPGISKLFLPRGSKKYYRGEYEVGNTKLYISNGVGNSSINFRLFSVPSINIYRLYTK